MKKKWLGILLTVAMVLAMLPGTAMAASSFSGGDGSETNPYQISSVEDLKQLAKDVNNGTYYVGEYFTLTQNLDLSGEDWSPIGQSSSGFAGIFDGNHHIIYNLTIQNGIRYSGLFGKLQGATVKATVKNLGLENVNIESSSTDIGGLAGNAKSSLIENCYVTGTVSGYAGTGGILGSTHSSSAMTTIKNCYVRAEISTTDHRGDGSGISGWNGSTSVKIINSYTACTGEERPIAGWSDGDDVRNSQFTSTYFDKTLSPNFSSEAGRTDLGRTSDELKNKTTFEDWDFATVWDINSTKNGGYPYLRGFTPGLAGAPASVTITVEDTDGNPVEGAEVVIRDSGNNDITLSHQGNGVYSGTVTTKDATFTIFVNSNNMGEVTQTDSKPVAKTVRVQAGHANHCVCAGELENGAIDGHTCANETWIEVDSLDDIPGPGAYYLTQDVDLSVHSATWNVPDGEVKLCLNGHKIIGASGESTLTLNGDNLTLTDCQGTGRITHKANEPGWGLYIVNGSTFTMYGGSITGNSKGETTAAGGMYCDDSFLNLYGGSITGNALPSNCFGGAINANAATVITLGGNIVIADNWKNGADWDNTTEQYVANSESKASNLHIRSASLTDKNKLNTPLKINNLTSSARIGVTLGNRADLTDNKVDYITITEAYDTDYSANFIPDNFMGTFEIVNVEEAAGKNVLQMRLATAAPNEYTIEYTGCEDANEVSTLPAKHTVGTATTIPDLTRMGYTFAGWKVNGTGDPQKNLVLGANDTFTGSAITLEACWTAKNRSDSSNDSFLAYIPKIVDPDHGTIFTTPRAPGQGDTVTITVRPDSGYEVGDVTVTGRNGKPVNVKDLGNGQYSFVQPGSQVTIEAEIFAEGQPGTTDDTACTGGTGCPLNAFADTDPKLWYHDGLHFCVEEGLLKGVTETRLAPNASLTRGMLVTILYRLEGEPAAAVATFADVEPTAYYAKAIGWAAQNGIVSGYSATGFGPNDSITREQLAAILYNYARYKNADVSVGEDTNILSYNDVFAASGYAIPALQWACGAGILTGMDSATLAPQGTATRAQAARMLMLLCQELNR